MMRYLTRKPGGRGGELDKASDEGDDVGRMRNRKGKMPVDLNHIVSYTGIAEGFACEVRGFEVHSLVGVGAERSSNIDSESCTANSPVWMCYVLLLKSGRYMRLLYRYTVQVK